MKTWAKWFIAVAAVLALSMPRAAANTGNEAFEKLKALAGHWENATPGGMKTALDIEVSSGGSAVIERLSTVENGKPVTMTTVYFLDGDAVKLTHYCMAGNQPTMKGTYDPATRTLKFDFASITGLKSPDDGYMHHALYTFVDNDHFKTKWTFRKNQKDAFEEEAVYVRTK
jgi:hypothetical protein